MATSIVNSLGMTLVRLEPGIFRMGQADGDLDERPPHRVRISQPFHMAATPVTNAQYEQFDPAHRQWRGERDLSNADDEAVLQVSWHEATAFCRWLAEREGQPYRLPTEAEWEFACRAGTTTPYHTGAELPEEYLREQKAKWHPTPVPLHVGRTAPNAWGLHDMHGLVEEWCQDWHGPYPRGPVADPVGPADGTFKVTRGGSHNTTVEYLRAANRLGTLPADRHWLIGFRVVLGELPETATTLPPPRAPRWAARVRRGRHAWNALAATLFAEPQPYVRVPAHPERVPMYAHNHCPSLTWCDNGDLLACWFSTTHETGRAMTILASRLRRGAHEWDLPSEFFKAPDRNMTGSALFNDGAGTLHHINGLEAASHWANLAVVLRTSRDNGVTWTAPRFVNRHHQPRNQVISGTSMTPDGCFIQPCDAVFGDAGGTAIHLSRDGGLTWNEPGAAAGKPDFRDGGSGGSIAGIHAGVVALRDGRLLAFGRGNNLPAAPGSAEWRMPMSVSADLGQRWTYAPSPFPPIAGGQRLALLRLREGPLLLVSFSDTSEKRPDPAWPAVTGIDVTDAHGQCRRGYGMFAALSMDDGATWPIRRLMTDGVARELDGGAWTRGFRMDADHAEPMGYLAATQSPDGVIHVISSALHYQLNLAWLTQVCPARNG